MSATRNITVTRTPKTYTAMFERTGVPLKAVFNYSINNWTHNNTNVLSGVGTYGWIDGFAIRDMLIGKTIYKIQCYGKEHTSTTATSATVNLIYYTDAPDINNINKSSKQIIASFDLTEGINEVILPTPITITNQNSAFGFADQIGYKYQLVDVLAGATGGTNIPSNVGIVFGLSSASEEPYEYSKKKPCTVGIEYFVEDEDAE